MIRRSGGAQCCQAACKWGSPLPSVLHGMRLIPALHGAGKRARADGWSAQWLTPARAVPVQAQQRRIVELEARGEAAARTAAQQGATTMAAQRRLSELQEELENNAGRERGSPLRVAVFSLLQSGK